MSFANYETTIKEGDTIILYLTAQSMHAIDVHPQIKNKKGDMVEYIFQTSFGAIKIKSLIGKTFGSKVELSRGWAYVLQPTPELWTQTLPHRTQIIYTPDISMILFQLDIKPGSIVIESGTGSGSLSHYFIRAIKPHGHLHTFDFHSNRVELAREEFRIHGLGEHVTAYHQDVCSLGFSDNLNGTVDAVFLDLPSPHLVVPSAKLALKKSGGRFCSFSPCIEQTQRACETLQQHNFVDIQTMEVLQIEDVIRTKTIPVLDLEFVKHKKNENDTIVVEDCGKNKTPKEMKKYLSSNAPATMPGHTGYLTFATLLPNFIA